LIKVLYNIANLGIKNDTPFDLRNKLKVFNNANLVIFCISVFYCCIGIAHHYYIAVAVTVYSILTNVFSFYLVSKGRYQFAFHYVMWYGFLFLSAFSILFGGANNSYYYFLFMPVACNIFFDKLKVTLFYLALSAVFMITNVFYIEHFPPHYVLESWMPYFSYPNILFACLLVFLGVRLFKQENIKYASQIEEQRKILEEKNQEITDSITYAKRLQEAILPPLNLIREQFPQSFVLYKPKDIVAGDFYWTHTVSSIEKTESSMQNKETITLPSDDCILIAAADSTGHGVPGAMVSVVCSNALNRTVNEFGITEPGKILDKTRELVLDTFSKSESEVKDGMDISLISISKTNDSKVKNIKWSGANNPLWYIQNNELKQIKAHKQAIGKTDNPTPFPTYEIELKKGNTIYLITDGFADQFGGKNGKKFKHKQLQSLLLATQHKPMEEQQSELEKVFESWKGPLDQVDDITIIGIRI
jgi:serine phosphatase RsbU (regulator of sigma subunit)